MAAGNAVSTAPNYTGRRALITAAAGGALMGLSWPPLGWWWASVLGLAAVVAAIHGFGWRRRLLTGEVAGTAFFGIGFLHTIADVPMEVILVEALAAGALAAFLAVAIALAPPGSWAVAGVPAAFVLVGALQGRWPIGGLPGVGLALGQAQGPLASAARWGGELGVVAVAAISGAALGSYWRQPRRRLPVVAAVVALVVGLAGGALAGDGVTTDRLDVAVVQGGGLRGVDAMGHEEFFDLQMGAARQLGAGHDLVLLAEGVAHVEHSVTELPSDRGFAALAKRAAAAVVAGVVFEGGEHTFRNSALVWEADGRLADVYDKRHGVPFGEYVPARGLLERLFDLSLTPDDILTGDKPGVLRSRAGDLGVVISFEVFFPRLVRDTVRAGAEVLVVPSSAASFPSDLAASIELSASRLRAIETGRWVIQATPTGHSAVIDHRGRVRAITPISESPHLIQQTVELRRGATPFVSAGAAPIIAAAGVVLMGAWAGHRRTRREMEHPDLRGRSADRVSAPA